MKQISTHVLRTVLIGGVLVFSFCYQKAFAQEKQKSKFSIGGSYEMRAQHPNQGFGIRLENELKLGIPLLALGVRAQYSRFTEEIKGCRGYVKTDHGEVHFNRKLSEYYLGLMALVKLKLGLLTPYAGLGIGTSQLTVKNTKLHDILESGAEAGSKSDHSIYYNGAVGASMTLLPVLHPFVEYRLQRNNFRDVINGYSSEANGGIWAFGVSLQF